VYASSCFLLPAKGDTALALQWRTATHGLIECLLKAARHVSPCASRFSWLRFITVPQGNLPRVLLPAHDFLGIVLAIITQKSHASSSHPFSSAFIRPFFLVVPTSANIFDKCQRNASGPSAKSFPLSQRGLRLMSRIRRGKL
jgi:hypothetical protein